jgi:hypothetical protein
VTADAHGDCLTDTRTNHVSHGRAPQIVKQLSRNVRFLASLSLLKTRSACFRTAVCLVA